MAKSMLKDNFYSPTLLIYKQRPFFITYSGIESVDLKISQGGIVWALLIILFQMKLYD